MSASAESMSDSEAGTPARWSRMAGCRAGRSAFSTQVGGHSAPGGQELGEAGAHHGLVQLFDAVEEAHVALLVAEPVFFGSGGDQELPLGHEFLHGVGLGNHLDTDLGCG